MPNYQEYSVNTKEEHNLHEDFTYKRPYAFKLDDESIKVKTWQQMLIRTCELLYALDQKRFIQFENDPGMKGRKQKIFSSNPDDMRSPGKIEGCPLYVETNLSANSIRNLISRILGRYGIKNNRFKIYLRADYSSMH